MKTFFVFLLWLIPGISFPGTSRNPHTAAQHMPFQISTDLGGRWVSVLAEVPAESRKRTRVGFWRQFNERTVYQCVGRLRKLTWEGEAPRGSHQWEALTTPGLNSRRRAHGSQSSRRWRRAVWKDLRQRRIQRLQNRGTSGDRAGAEELNKTYPNLCLSTFWSPVGASH